MKIATPKIRLAAFVIDFSIMLLIFQIIFIPYLTTQTETLILDKGISLVSWFLIIAVAYKLIQTYLVSHFGGTLGHLLTGLQIVSEEGHVRLSFKRALFREYVGNVVASVFFGMGYFWIIKDPKHQGWHDMVSKTYVMAGEKETIRIAVAFAILGLLINFFIARDNVARIQNQVPMYTRMGQMLEESPKPTPRTIWYDGRVSPPGYRY